MGIIDTLRSGLVGLLLRSRYDGFDVKYGTDTSTVVAIRYDEAPSLHEEARSIPSHPKIIRFVLDNCDINFRDFTFVDFGCGKGRALLCASEFPFSRIIGVEWSQDLSIVARRNIDIFKSSRQQCTDIIVESINVLDFQFPSSNILLYMYNPFGVKLTRQVFQKIKDHITSNQQRFLVAFTGLGKQEKDLVIDCYLRSGLQIIKKYHTLYDNSSWILGENSPVVTERRRF